MTSEPVVPAARPDPVPEELTILRHDLESLLTTKTGVPLAP